MPDASMADCNTEIITQNAIQISRNSTFVVYSCRQDFYLASGDLVRMCSNGSWSGIEPSCIVNSVLPKQLLVLLIVGVTVTLFAFCIPLDFYRFRQRKRACREKQERINMMVRIQPFHAKYMGAMDSTDEEEPAPRRSFGIGSILAFFRLVKNRRNRRSAAPAESPKPKTPTPEEEDPQPDKTSERGTIDDTEILCTNVPLPNINSKPERIPSPIPRTKSLGSGVGTPTVKVVTPRSATFTNSKCLPPLQTSSDESVKNESPVETVFPPKQDIPLDAGVSVVDEFMDTRGYVLHDRRKPNMSHPASRPSKPFKLNITRYNVASRDTGGATISSCNPLPSVGSSPSRSPICPVDMGF